MDATRSIHHALTFHIAVQRICKQRSTGSSAACREDHFCENALQSTLKMMAYLEAGYFPAKILLAVLPIKHVSD